MIREYLRSSPVMATTSLEEARAAVSEVYLPHDLDGPADALDLHLNAQVDRYLTVGYLTYQAQTRLRMPPSETAYHVNLTVAGHTRAAQDGGRESTVADRSGVVISPVRHSTVWWGEDAEQIILRISRTRLESHLAGLLGTPVTEPIHFDLGLDLTTACGATLLSSARFLATELDQPGGLAAMPLAREQLESYVLTTLLHAGRHQFSDSLRTRSDTRRLGRLAPVVAHVEEHTADELTPELLAHVGCVSVRTLHTAFQAQLGISPMGYVRRVRLGRVREELLSADPGHVRVADVALRWGFAHPSRFAQQYRDQFDELPSVTLHR